MTDPEQPITVPNLEMIPTSDLIDEVMRRCSPAVFIGTRYEGETNNRSFKNFERWQGNLDTCRGMCHEMDSIMQREMIRQELAEEDSDEA